MLVGSLFSHLPYVLEVQNERRSRAEQVLLSDAGGDWHQRRVPSSWTLFGAAKIVSYTIEDLNIRPLTDGIFWR